MPRTVYALAKNGTLNMFLPRQRLNPLIDAEYGSAACSNTTAVEYFRIMVSTAGVLIKKVEKGQLDGPPFFLVQWGEHGVCTEGDRSCQISSIPV